MSIYDMGNFDLHLTQLNCAIANWATNIRIICRPTQMLLALATGRLLILILDMSWSYLCSVVSGDRCLFVLLILVELLTINVSFHNILEKYIHKSYTYGISLVSDP